MSCILSQLKGARSWCRLDVRFFGTGSEHLTDKKSPILRKLGASENSRLASKGTKLFTKSIRVSTKMNLYANVKVINKSIRQWMLIHPFLQASVAEIGADKYFVVNERLAKDAKSLHTNNETDLPNVEYLLLKSPADGQDGGLFDDTSQLLVEKELNTKDHFDIYKQLLWHMKFFTIERSSPAPPLFEYEIILVIHHIVSDRRNSHMILLQLLNIIERNVCIAMGKMNKNMAAKHNNLAFNFMPSIEELFTDAYIHKSKSSEQQQQQQQQLVEIERPPFGNSADRSCWMPYKNLSDAVLASSLYQLDSTTQAANVQEYAKMEELVKISKASSLKFRRYILNELTTNRLIQKCLDEKCRLTGSLNILMCYSLSKLFKKLDYVSRPFVAAQAQENKASEKEPEKSGENETKSSSSSSIIKYLTPISLRGRPTNDAKQPTIDSYMMGYCVSTVPHQLEMAEYKDNASSFKLDQFWSQARADTYHLHNSIKQGDFHQGGRAENDDGHQGQGLAWHFQTANMGISPSKTSNRNAGFATRITHVFSEGVIASEREPDTLLFAGFATIEDRLCVTFQYDSRLIGHGVVDDVVKNFFFFVREVCRDRDMDPSYDSPFYKVKGGP